MTPSENSPAIPRSWTAEHALPIIPSLQQFPRWRYLGPVASRLESDPGQGYVAAAGTPPPGVPE
jgi:hypothetical protein